MASIRMLANRVAAALAVGSTLCTVASAAPSFRILPYQVPEGAKYCLPATVINDGSVTGFCRFEGLRDVLYNWAPDGTFKALPVQQRVIVARNDSNQAVAMTLEAEEDYFYAAPGQPPIAFLRGTWAKPVYWIVGINERGVVLGDSAIDCCTTSPWLWSLKQGLTPIFEPPLATDLTVTRLNNRGQVTGSISGACESRAFVYDARARQVRYLGPGAFPRHPGSCEINSRATALNDAGQVVGMVGWNFDPGRDSAYLWAEGKRAIRMAGNGDDPNARGYYPVDINNRGQVVGSFSEFRPVLGAVRAFYWDQVTPATRLSELIDPADPLLAQVELREEIAIGPVEKVPAITESGEIVVRGFLKPREPGQVPDRFFRLIPTGVAK